ncbi:peptidoglycan-binding domain-containing protein [Streptomyces mesophilus]|nr:peptidoglycan-binding domain-containing protein [Streptomyces mesophilus]
MTCPECGAPRDRSGAPQCGCAQRAADALRDGRSADAAADVAASEDFDPLRIRPYVSLSPEAETTDDTARLPVVYEAAAPPAVREPRAADVDRFVPGGSEAGYGGDAGYGSDAGYEVELERAAPQVGPGPSAVRGGSRGRRRRPRTALLAICGAAVAVVAVAATASGFFSGDDDGTREQALPDRSTSAPASSVAPSPSEKASKSASPSPSASKSASASASPSASPSKSPSASPSPTLKASGTATTSQPPQSTGTLQQGDSGPAVEQMQGMLRDVWVYHGRPDGNFDDKTRDAVEMFQVWYGVNEDPKGVYGPATRAALERAVGDGDRQRD